RAQGRRAVLCPFARLRGAVAGEPAYGQRATRALPDLSNRPLWRAAPARCEPRLAANGPGNFSVHRRAVLAVDGRARVSQRYAIDWVRPENGSTFRGKREDNSAYHAYGAEVIAVADGTIVAVKDGIPENVPGLTSRAVPITLETIGGNLVVHDIGQGQYAFYAHLQPGSLRVKP